jgi:hypothetical protein
VLGSGGGDGGGGGTTAACFVCCCWLLCFCVPSSNLQKTTVFSRTSTWLLPDLGLVETSYGNLLTVSIFKANWFLEPPPVYE